MIFFALFAAALATLWLLWRVMDRAANLIKKWWTSCR